ncbi:MAG: glycerol-3-phosphate 1-O-acyltransferase [Gammaproteobacteria bacterium]|nr:glycerol-3-phosphate 1-O-acyltransferase [Gammaproteobacteria bacterium]MDH3362206.1 glycerol-3-phosphate 1-O-acyltransferase [Gammaproteobacteria bacterium]MDH3480355.1 glycerol-3-phosphate 1-O-acyltransferase [Gammaproteobacteria bacterium]
MKVSPWPTNDTRNVLIVLDAAHRIEQQHLESWLERERNKRGYSGTVEHIVLPLSESAEDLPAGKLFGVPQVTDDTLVVPVRVVWLKGLDVKGTTPRLRDLLLGSPRRPGPMRARYILKKHPMRAKCISGRPATFEELRQRLEHRLGATPDRDQLAQFVAGQASIALDIAERRLRGSRYKVPRHVAHNLKSRREFVDALQDLSAETGRSISDLKAEADKILKELISVPQAFWLDMSYLLNRTISTLGYDKEIVVDREVLQRIRRISKQHPTAILCTHKTHVDFPALNKVMFDHDFPALHTMGGVNMAFAGIGFLARRAGVIFIRRSFNDDLLYKLILRQYIGYLMEKNFPLSWAFEGTRSRVGKLMPPKYGILKYVLDAAHANDSRKLHIIPVALNYDLISDVRDYAREQSGRKKRPESLRWFLGYMRSLNKPMGKIYMNFGEPVVLDEVPSGEDRIALAKIALQAGVEANRVTPITLASLATMLLLGSSPRALTRHELAIEIKEVVLWANARNIKITRHFEIENESELAAMAKVLVNNGMLTRYDDGPEEVYAIAPRQHGVANYYRNTTIHHFVTKAIAELALLRASTDQQAPLQTFWEEVNRLRDLFKFEFFYAPREAFHHEVAGELRRYAADWEEKLAQEAEFASRLLRSFRPLVAYATLTQFVEAYFVVADVAAITPPEKALQHDDCLRRCFPYGREAYLRQRISSEASIGKQLFENGYKWIENRGLAGAGDEDIAERRVQASQGLRELMHRLQQIKALALPV